jgi:hypothetical protein
VGPPVNAWRDLTSPRSKTRSMAIARSRPDASKKKPLHPLPERVGVQVGLAVQDKGLGGTDPSSAACRYSPVALVGTTTLNTQESFGYPLNPLET